MVLLISPSADELSVTTGVLDCGCTISSKAVLSGMAALQFKNKAAVSASEADGITCLMILDSVKMAQLLLSLCVLSLR